MTGDITCLATIGPEIQAQAQFLAKEDGVVGGIAMADLVFSEVDSSLQVRSKHLVMYFLLSQNQLIWFSLSENGNPKNCESC